MGSQSEGAVPVSKQCLYIIYNASAQAVLRKTSPGIPSIPLERAQCSDYQIRVLRDGWPAV